MTSRGLCGKTGRAMPSGILPLLRITGQPPSWSFIASSTIVWPSQRVSPPSTSCRPAACPAACWSFPTKTIGS
ncbi:hypothetical protein VTK73DRAFT_3848 [Phialemonium thermophilum]|uniref:Uncharacterized protein n=1 Tax=Phialemonium thermophilum TaxID=223376 RepID=A0ABR3WXA0_9PEZI